MGINTPLYEMPIKLNKGDFKCCSKQQFVEIPLRENCLCCSQFVRFSVSGQVMDGVYRDVLLRATDFFFSLILLLGDRSIKSLNPGHVGLLLELIV